MAEEAEYQHLENRLKIHQRNLRTLEDQIAQHGIYPPLGMVNELNHQKSEIARIKALLSASTPESVARPSDHAPARVLSDPTANRRDTLPTYFERFIGRARDLAEVRSRLLSPDIRLLTLHGLGGVGKTRLSVQAVGELHNDFKDGIYFIPLDQISEPDLVVTLIAQKLDILNMGDLPTNDLGAARNDQPPEHADAADDPPIANPIDDIEHTDVGSVDQRPVGVVQMRRQAVVGQRSELFTSTFSQISARILLIERLREYLKDRQTLLVLDNFEHVIDAATQIGALLGDCLNLKILVTSRERLNIEPEHVYHVNRLETPKIRHLPPLEQLAENDALKLFYEAACRVKDDFALTSETAPQVAEICHEAHGIPLYIVMAAAWIGQMSPLQISCGITSHRSTFLTGQGRDRPQRHRSEHAVLDWSYNLLKEPESSLFIRLAVFTGGFTPEAVERVCLLPEPQTPPFRLLLRALASKSLLESGKASGPDQRYLMLEIVREYAIEHLKQCGEETLMRQRHAEYYLNIAEQAAPKLERLGSTAWLDRLESDLGNLRAALKWFQDQAQIEAMLRLASALRIFWMERGDLAEGRRFLETARDQQVNLSESTRARALDALGALVQVQGDYRDARSCYEQSLQLAKQTGDEAAAAAAHASLAALADGQGDFATAAAEYQNSLTLRSSLGDSGARAVVHSRLARMAARQGDLERACSNFEESLKLWRYLNDCGEHGLSLIWLARIAYRQEDTDSAETRYEQSRAILQQLEDQQVVGRLLMELGDYMLERKRYDLAAAYYQESLELCRSTGNRRDEAALLAVLGKVAYRQKEYDRARELRQQSCVLYEDIGERQAIARINTQLGHEARAQREYQRAETYYAKSRDIYRRLDNQLGQAEAQLNLGQLAYEQEAYEKAKTRLMSGKRLYEEMGNNSGLANCLMHLGNIALTQKSFQDAEQAFRCARNLFEQLNDPKNEGWTWNNLGLVEYGRNNYDQAIANYKQGLELRRAYNNGAGCIQWWYSSSGAKWEPSILY